MYVLCNNCCRTELHGPPSSEIPSNSDVEQYFCALCQSWHVGEKPTNAKQQCEDCDLPFDEVPPICKAAFALVNNGERPRNESRPSPPKPLTKNQPRGGPVATSESSVEIADQAGPLMILRDTVLGLVGQLEKINVRLQKIETKTEPSSLILPSNNEKSTQTQSDSSLYPPACQEALVLWENYKISQKSETEILIEALKSLDLKKVIENQNKQLSQQTNMINNMSRNFSKFSKMTESDGTFKKANESGGSKNSQNGSRSKKSKK